MPPPRAFVEWIKVKVYVFADESGTFDVDHNTFFTYGGVVILSKDAYDYSIRKYLGFESSLRENNESYKVLDEIKASNMTLRDRKRAFKLINDKRIVKFCIVINQKKLQKEIFNSKQSKQRFLDYALKRGIKEGINTLIYRNGIKYTDIDNVQVIVDEHSTSTNGRYDLYESIVSELIDGTFNFNYQRFYPAILRHLSRSNLKLQYLDSKNHALIRLSDVIANWAYMAVRDFKEYPEAYSVLRKNTTILYLP